MPLMYRFDVDGILYTRPSAAADGQQIVRPMLSLMDDHRGCDVETALRLDCPRCEAAAALGTLTVIE